MKMVKRIGLAALLLGVVAGCATPPAKEESSASADAIAAAKAAIAAAGDCLWRDTEKLLKEAEAAAAAGDEAKAVELAEKAKTEAELAKTQCESEKARLSGNGGVNTYVVKRGDNLWNISGKSEVYGNPYQWPLLYKANRNKIQDADLIYPGQNFQIERGASQADVDAAIMHAKTRGAWSIGVVEESDKAYLSR